MKQSSLPVIAVITNYNMAESLVALLPQVLAQHYRQVFVVDDASTDDSVARLKAFPKVHVVAGKTNVGSGANRNRVLEVLGYDAIIHFLDADVRLTSQDTVKKAQELFANSRLGLAGGLVALPDKQQMIFNFGPCYSLYAGIGGYLQIKLGVHSPWRRLFHYFLKVYPDPNHYVAHQQVFWVSEANMLVTSAAFRSVGGFNPELRYHEIQDLSLKLHAAGYIAVYDDRISVEHPFLDLASPAREKAQKTGLQWLIKHYGWRLK